MQSYDVIVAGLGAMGSAALDHVSGRGARTLGIEPFGIPHGVGSSGGDSRLVRKAYFEHSDYVPLLERAYQNWRALEAETGESLLHTVGTLYLGREDSDLIAGSRRSAVQHGLPLETVSSADLQRDYPQFRCPEDYVALFEPEAGFVLCEQAVRAQVARALDRGATLAVGERLMDWQAHGDSVLVTTDRGHYSAASLVLAVGSWSPMLLGDLDVVLRVTRQPLFWVRPPAGAHLTLGRSPCWAVQRPDVPGLIYGFPALPGSMGTRLGVKLGHHHPGDVVDPDGPRRGATGAELGAVLTAVVPFVPALRGPMTAAHVCLYTNTADGHFAVGAHPRHANVVVACGFSGHGFKFAPVMGEVLADLALQRQCDLPIGFLGFERFLTG